MEINLSYAVESKSKFNSVTVYDKHCFSVFPHYCHSIWAGLEVYSIKNLPAT